MHVVDVPGHPKVFGDAMRLIGRNAHWLLILDSTPDAFALTQKRQAAEMVLLVQSANGGRRRLEDRLTVLCNKQDVADALAVDVIRRDVQMEYDALRKSRLNDVMRHDDDNGKGTSVVEDVELDWSAVRFVASSTSDPDTASFSSAWQRFFQE
jgi:signal recognition particle receptor subunit beta